MHIYTKTGDNGTTMLIGGNRVQKSDSRVEAYGTLDELDAYIGLISSIISDKEDAAFIKRIPLGTEELLHEVRKALFAACSFVACGSLEAAKKLQSPDVTIVAQLEKSIDDISEKLPKEFTFSILANNYLSSNVNIARTVCRRAERRLVAIEGDVAERQFVAELLNRLSDYLYVLLRICMD